MPSSAVGGGYVSSYVIEAIDKFSKTLEEFTKKFEDAQRKASDSAKKIESSLSFEKMGKDFANLGKQISLYVSAPLAALGILSIRAASNLEYMISTVKPFVGQSKEIATNLVGGFKEMADGSIFNLSEITASARILLTVGENADTVTAKVKRLSDIAATFNMPLDFLTTQYDVMQQNKRTGSHQAMALARQGVPIYEELSKAVQKMTGKKYSTEKIREFVKENRISAKAFEQVVMQMTDKGGIAYKGMENNTDNLRGSMLKLKNVANGVLEEFGYTINQSMGGTKKVGEMADKVKGLSDKFALWAKNNPTTAKNIVILGAALAILPPVILGISKAVGALSLALMANPVIAALTAMLVLTALIIANEEQIKKFLNPDNLKYTEERGGRAPIIHDPKTGENKVRVGGGMYARYGRPMFYNDEEYRGLNTPPALKAENVLKITIADPFKVVKSVEASGDPSTIFDLGSNVGAAR